MDFLQRLDFYNYFTKTLNPKYSISTPLPPPSQLIHTHTHTHTHTQRYTFLHTYRSIYNIICPAFYWNKFNLLVVVQLLSCVQLCDPTDCSTPGFPVLHNPRACSKSCPFSRWYHPTISSSVVPFSSCLPSFPALSLFQWVGSSHQVTKVLELQLQHQSFQWIFVDFIGRVDFL